MTSHHELQPLNQQQLPYPPQQQPPYPPQQIYQPPSTSSFNPQQQVHFAPPHSPQQQVYFAPSAQQEHSPYNPTTSSMAPYDPEGAGGESFGFDDQSIRKGFIRKVFSILSVQLAFTTGIISIFVFYKPAAVWVMNNIWVYWVSLVAMFVVLIMIACCESMRRKSPMNFVLLGILTACMSLMLGFTCAFFDTWEVMLAVGITVVVTVSLVIFAFQTKWDFTTMGGVLFVAIIVLVFLAIFSLIFQNRVVTIVYASIGALIFCIYLVYDIQLMMGGKHKYSISPEEYIFASLNLYIDIVNIFMYILMIISASRS